MNACGKCGKKFGFLDEKWDSKTVYHIDSKDLSLDDNYPDNRYSGKIFCFHCYKEIYKNAPPPNLLKQNSPFLLECKNASLTQSEFHYELVIFDWVDEWLLQKVAPNERVEKQCWLISDMTMALVENNNSLCITFKDGTKKEFELDVNRKATSQQWATAINMLISKRILPKMIYCKYCKTKNNAINSNCVHCGAILE